MLRGFTTLSRVRECGWTAVREGGVLVRMSGEAGGDGSRAGFSGVSTCGSVWACPVCAEKIQARRREDLVQLINAAAERDCTVLLITLTMRHSIADQLADLWNDLSKAWAAVNRDGSYRRGREANGQIGWVRAVESTRGDHGWHLHIHALVVVKGKWSRERAEAYGALLWTPWHRYLAARPGREPVPEAFDVRVGERALEAFAEYMAKATFALDDDARGALAEAYSRSYEGLASEVTMSTHKRGRMGGRTPFEILRDLQQTAAEVTTDDGRTLTVAEEADARLWLEWEKASHRRRQLTWSKGLREWAGLDEDEQSDEEIAEEDLGGDDVIGLPAETWRAVRRQSWLLLDLVENGGRAALCAWLDSRGLDWFEAHPHRPRRPDVPLERPA